MTLERKVCLITGGARRIGAAITRCLHDAGANVAIHFRSSAADAQELADELNDRRSDSALTIAGDLLDIGSHPALINATVRQFGRMDGLINNASSFYPTPLGDIGEDDWNDLVGTNLKVPLFLAQAAAPELRKSSGGIINVIDIHAQRPMRDHLVYCSAKAGLAMLTRGLARELAPDIRVNGVAPGTILWPERGLDEGTKSKILERTPLQRAGEPEDIARCILYLLRDARYVTGQIIAVDGGRSIGW